MSTTVYIYQVKAIMIDGSIKAMATKDVGAATDYYNELIATLQVKEIEFIETKKVIYEERV